MIVGAANWSRRGNPVLPQVAAEYHLYLVSLALLALLVAGTVHWLGDAYVSSTRTFGAQAGGPRLLRRAAGWEAWLSAGHVACIVMGLILAIYRSAAAPPRPLGPTLT